MRGSAASRLFSPRPSGSGQTGPHKGERRKTLSSVYESSSSVSSLAETLVVAPRAGHREDGHGADSADSRSSQKRQGKSIQISS